MDWNDLKDLSLLMDRPAYRIMSGLYKDRPVIVKIATKAGLSRCLREAGHLIRLCHKNIVKYYGMGQTNDLVKDGRFLVLERLNTDWPIRRLALENIFEQLLSVLYYMAYRGVFWTPRIEHMGVDDKGVLKIFDFNDDEPGEMGFFDFQFTDIFGRHEQYFNIRNLFKFLLQMYKSDTMDEGFFTHVAMGKLVIAEYQQLEDVHQPIPSPKFASTLKRETEENSPDYRQLVPPNRKCEDRWKLLLNVVPLSYWEHRSVLDVGANIGWFSARLAEIDARVTALEKDPRKVAFIKLISYWLHVPIETYCVEIDQKTYFGSYDYVLALSVLHKFGSWDIVQEILTRLWNNTKIGLFVELPDWWFRKFNARDLLLEHMASMGATSKVLGKTNAKRDLYCFKRQRKDVIAEMQAKWQNRPKAQE